MKLWLVRHATPLVPPGTCYGHLDVAADASATATAAQALARALPAEVRLRASPLRRCEQLALSLQGLRPDLACTTDARLAELGGHRLFEFGEADLDIDAVAEPWTQAALAHARSMLSDTGLMVPFGDGRLLLGTWQGIYLWEHRTSPHRRRVVVTVLGS